ncbi:hypothetical protein BH11ACT5_BH11ACT5_27510 [soil metagenome]
MVISVVAYREEWPQRFEAVAAALLRALADVPIRSIKHVGSTAVPGLAAKPILGMSGREALRAPDADPARHVYVCAEGNLHVRNHLAVRRVLRERSDLRDRYAAAKLGLAYVIVPFVVCGGSRGRYRIPRSVGASAFRGNDRAMVSIRP